MPPSIGIIQTLPSWTTPGSFLKALYSDGHALTFDTSMGWISLSRIRRAVSSVQTFSRSVPKPPRIFATASSLLENVAVENETSGYCARNGFSTCGTNASS